jgi:hypothetical protein
MAEGVEKDVWEMKFKRMQQKAVNREELASVINEGKALRGQELSSQSVSKFYDLHNLENQYQNYILEQSEWTGSCLHKWTVMRHCMHGVSKSEVTMYLPVRSLSTSISVLPKF